jgi:N-acetylglucosamine transport system substrate-binding protein
MKQKKSFSRRAFLKYSALVSASAVLSACVPAQTTEAPAEAPQAPAAAEAPAAAPVPPDLPFEVAPEAVNPLGLESGTSVEGIFFEGGYGRGYIDFAADIFRQLHPENPMTVEGIQRVGEQLRPRFIGGNPPDVIDNSGAGNLDTAALVAEEQLLDLAPLMEAPALDTPGKTFAETLFPGSQDTGKYNGIQYVLNIAYTVFGIWHSNTLFEEKGWEYPKTWDAMLDMGEMIKNEGISPWTYQGKFPGYMVFGVLIPLIYKNGGLQAIIDIDNLVDGAWETDAVRTSVQQMGELAVRDYIMPGTEGLTHTEAQAEWLQGKAVFLPCGTWLENEMRDLTPEDFEMVVNPVPGAQGEDTFNSIYTSSGELYFVPSQGENPIGGMEYLRCLLSKESAKYFAQNVSSIMPVAGGTEGIEVSSAMQSALQAVENAGDEIFSYRFSGWYRDLSDEVTNRTGDLLTNRIGVDEFIESVQKKADEVKADDSIQKYERVS